MKVIKKNKLGLINNGIYIAHYYLQDLETYFERKFLRFNNDIENINIIDFFIKNYNKIEKKEEYFKDKNNSILKFFKRFIKDTNKIINIHNRDIYNFYYDIDTTTNNKNKIKN